MFREVTLHQNITGNVITGTFTDWTSSWSWWSLGCIWSLIFCWWQIAKWLTIEILYWTTPAYWILTLFKMCIFTEFRAFFLVFLHFLEKKILAVLIYSYSYVIISWINMKKSTRWSPNPIWDPMNNICIDKWHGLPLNNIIWW